jgi:hypothetical protein
MSDEPCNAVIEKASGAVFFVQDASDYADDAYVVLPAPDDFMRQRYAWDGAQLVSDIALAKATALDGISKRFYAVLGQGCASPKGWVDCDDKAQARITSAVSLMRELTTLEQAPETLSWTMFDKSPEPHALADLVQLGIAIGMRTQALFGVKQALESAVEAATSVEGLDAIDIEGSWPT